VLPLAKSIQFKYIYLMTNHMEVAKVIRSQLTHGRDIQKVWSWGARDWTATPSSVHGDVVDGVLQFRVSGRKFKGIIEIALMPSDTYTVTLFRLNKNAPNGVKIVETVYDVYFDVLTDCIDRLVET
jgi:hypothetical protein